MTSLRQPVGVWHEIVMRTPRAVYGLYLVLHFTCEHFMFCPSSAVNKTVIHIAFKCIAWSSCLCVNRPIWRIYIDKTTLRIGYVQFLCELTMMRLSFLLEQFVRLPDMGF